MTIQDIVDHWKEYALLGCAILAAFVGTYFKGHSDGFDEADNGWRAAIAEAKPVEVHRDTLWMPAKPDSSSFAVQTILKAEYQKKVQALVNQAQVLSATYANKEDSLQAINANLTLHLQSALSPKLIHLSTPALGDLVLKYFPADSSANVYKHIPPPERVVTVYLEKSVIEPESTWTTIGRYTLGIAVGAVMGYVIASQ